jgi:hypothetical protein
MPSQNRPSSKRSAPDPASSYGREKPQKEAGQGRLDNNQAIPEQAPDRSEAAVPNRHPPRQINASDDDQRATVDPTKPLPPGNVDHSMHDEEPLGWDQAPMEKKRPRDRRQPKTEGKGGTP